MLLGGYVLKHQNITFMSFILHYCKLEWFIIKHFILVKHYIYNEISEKFEPFRLSLRDLFYKNSEGMSIIRFPVATQS